MNLHQFAETHDVTNQPPSLDGTNLYRIAALAPVGPKRELMPTARWRVGR